MKNKPEELKYINDLSKDKLLKYWNAYCVKNYYDNEIREANYVLSLYAEKIMHIRWYDGALEFLTGLLRDMKKYGIPEYEYGYTTCYMVGDACYTSLGFKTLGTYDDVLNYVSSDREFLYYMNNIMVYDDEWLTKNGYDLEGDDDDDE